MWEIGVISFIKVIIKPLFCIERIAVSLPDPGPFIFISICLIPCSMLFLMAVSQAVWAAKGVPFLAPLNPQDPEDAHAITLPLLSVMDTIELFQIIFYFYV